MTLEATEPQLQGNFTIRHATLDDLELIVSLLHINEREYYGHVSATVNDLRNEYTTPDFDLSRSTRLVLNSAGELVGYAELWDVGATPVRPWLYFYVHPDYRHHGIETYLYHWAEKRAQEVISRVPDHARVVLGTSAPINAEPTARLLESFGMTTHRRSWNMLIELTETPPAPQLPANINITTFASYNDHETVYRAFREVWRDHRGYIEEPFEIGFPRWLHQITTDEDFTPDLWFLAMDGDTIAGFSLCWPKAWDDKEKGWVGILGVKREYRRGGLGLALLHHTFSEFWARGVKKVGLGVDAASITGATRLYERAGMHVFRAWDIYEKELRPGEELSTQ